MERGSQNVARALSLLKSEGIQIALDDFGTGYSSLSHLRDYPVDVVKIDRSFVARMGKDREIEAIVRAVVNLAASLNIESVAEGVETREQAHLLKLADCDLGQGYLFGRAVEAEVIAASLRTRAAA
jgi:EAL domain-containing protein (putative c-di-GMP-specific phosphodiesterase class I)